MQKKNLAKAVELRHELHAHPELSYEERWTKDTLMNFLKLHTNLELHDKGRYFYAIYKSKNPEEEKAIAFRADIDALPIEDQIDKSYKSQIPGIGHKCGHDGHAATLCGLALEIEEMELNRNVYLVFQHAEETGQGAIEAKECLLENDEIGEIYAYHNQTDSMTGKIAVSKGVSNCASKGMSISMTGTPTHASLPEKGKNPVFALANIVSQIPRIADPQKYKGILLCTVVQLSVGEYAYGVAANRGVLRLTIRGEYEEELGQLQNELMLISSNEAEKAGVSCAFSFEDEFPETRNNVNCAEKVLRAAKLLGLNGVEKKDGPFRGSEDFGHFLKARPGALFFVGNGVNCPSFHTVAYDFNDEVIEYAVELFKMLIEL